MKYIRTKDGIFENKPLEKHLGKRKGKGFEIVFKEEDIINQANTIEELCDEFVIANIDDLDGWIEDTFKGMKSQWHCDINWDKDDDYNYYGAIWTNKGLIYVAKMNDKGELELL